MYSMPVLPIREVFSSLYFKLLLFGDSNLNSFKINISGSIHSQIYIYSYGILE